MNTKYRMIGQLDSTISGKLLYLLLLDTVDTQNKIQLSQRRIAGALGISQGTVSRNFHRLKRGGGGTIRGISKVQIPCSAGGQNRRLT